MNPYLLSAAILCFILGLAHSFLGERLIFRDKRSKGQLVPDQTTAGFKRSHLRISWANWHITTAFAWCIGMVLLQLASARQTLNLDIIWMIGQSITYAMGAASLLVLVATKGRHPAWTVLLLIGILTVLGT